MTIKDIEKRWNERVIPNGWDQMGARGARAYLQRYGRNIGQEKVIKLSQYARSKNAIEFADELIRLLPENV